MIYLTCNEGSGGVFRSQVVDVVNYANLKLNKSIRIYSLISFRNFFETRRKLKCNSVNIVVLPMFPLRFGVWPTLFFYSFLFWLHGRDKIICRGIYAASFGIALRRIGLTGSVVYDGRGAAYAEANEYYGRNNNQMIRQTFRMEKNAVLKSDYRIAVSEKLVEYWEMTYQFNKAFPYTVIPTTLGSDQVITDFADERKILVLREKYKLESDAVLLIYSGSAAEWQSFQLLFSFLNSLLSKNNKIHVLFLIRDSSHLHPLKSQYPDRIHQLWVEPEEVQDILLMGDYGILIREKSVTNKVAAPTKYAEYLLSGLKVVISPEIGDYSELTRTNDLGLEWDPDKDFDYLKIRTISYAERKRIHEFSRSYFCKERFHFSYEKIFKV